MFFSTTNVISLPGEKNNVKKLQPGSTALRGCEKRTPMKN
jgi:hypothetical protein